MPSDRVFSGARDEHDFRISIAGAQEKTALLRHRGGWMVPVGATPSTHIFKLPMGVVGGMRRIDHLESIDNEWLCLRLLRALGLPVAQAELAVFEDQRVLVVERFDRSRQGGWLARLPQEDFCQATGTPPSMKYEADGGPGMDKCLRVLAGADDPSVDRAMFLLAQFAFWMLAAIDGHAKNFSMFLAAGDRYALTPLYDVMSAYPVMGNSPTQIRWHDMKLAMGVKSRNKHYLLKEIQPRHWKSLAQRAGEPGLELAMTQLADAVPQAIEHAGGQLPMGFPMRVFDTISAGLQKQAQVFLRAK